MFGIPWAPFSLVVTHLHRLLDHANGLILNSLTGPRGKACLRCVIKPIFPREPGRLSHKRSCEEPSKDHIHTVRSMWTKIDMIGWNRSYSVKLWKWLLGCEHFVRYRGYPIMKLHDQAFGGDNNLNRDLWDKTLLSILSSQTFEMESLILGCLGNSGLTE